MQEHPLDRIMRSARPFLIAAFVISGPVMLLSYGWMLKNMVASLGWWGAPVFVAHILTWIAISSLFDARQERLRSSED